MNGRGNAVRFAKICNQQRWKQSVDFNCPKTRGLYECFTRCGQGVKHNAIATRENARKADGSDCMAVTQFGAGIDNDADFRIFS